MFIKAVPKLMKKIISVLIDFCKLTIDYLNNGINEKKCFLAAGERFLYIFFNSSKLHKTLCTKFMPFPL